MEPTPLDFEFVMQPSEEMGYVIGVAELAQTLFGPVNPRRSWDTTNRRMADGKYAELSRLALMNDGELVGAQINLQLFKPVCSNPEVLDILEAEDTDEIDEDSGVLVYEGNVFSCAVDSCRQSVLDVCRSSGRLLVGLTGASRIELDTGVEDNAAANGEGTPCLQDQMTLIDLRSILLDGNR